MTIDIHINAKTAEEARAELRALLGDGLLAKLNETDTALRAPATATYTPAEIGGSVTLPAGTVITPENYPGIVAQALANGPAEEPKKRTRRTKAEIEAERAAGAAPQISTGEARVGPEDDAETQAQDAADEAAEVEAARDPEAPLTRHDVMKAAVKYQERYGMPAVQSDLPEIFGKVFGPVPEGTTNSSGRVVTKWGVGSIPGDQAALAKALAAVETALAENTFKREVVA